jgi:hypothetical protein
LPSSSRYSEVLDSVLIPLPGDAVSYARRTELSPTLLRKPQQSSVEDAGKYGTIREVEEVRMFTP